jgi:membrane-associated phospholipid phosphatase
LSLLLADLRFFLNPMRPSIALFALICAASCATAQENAVPATYSPISGTKGVCPSELLGDNREVSLKKIAPNILCDQKRVWTFSWRLVHGKNVLPTAAVVGVTAGLIALDATDARYFRRTSSFHQFNHVVSGINTGLFIGLVPASFYAVGLFSHDSYAQQTALLAGEAVVDAEIVSVVMKDVGRRLTPLAIPPNGNFSDTWFKRNGKWWAANGAFPSGHAVAAFSVATVIARRYGTHKWVPYVAYGAVGLITFSRLTLSAHFASDLFMGAALGYSITRFAVLR